MIKFSSVFLKNAKTLKKKFKKLDLDLKEAIKEIENNDLGTSLGFKISKYFHLIFSYNSSFNNETFESKIFKFPFRILSSSMKFF